MRREISRTFHGRDVFAPAAGLLARGVVPAELGKKVTDFIRSLEGAPEQVAKNVWAGTILKVDRFGNLITNLQIGHFSDVKARPIEVQVRDQVSEAVYFE